MNISLYIYFWVLSCYKLNIFQNIHFNLDVLNLFLDKGKITIKEATQVSGYLLRLHFYMFKRSQGKHNSLDCHNFFGIFSIICKVYTFIVLTWIKNVFACSKHSIFVFLQILFFLANVHHSCWKLKRILTLMIRRAKVLELMIFFYNPFEHI